MALLRLLGMLPLSSRCQCFRGPLTVPVTGFCFFPSFCRLPTILTEGIEPYTELSPDDLIVSKLMPKKNVCSTIKFDIPILVFIIQPFIIRLCIFSR